MRVLHVTPSIARSYGGPTQSLAGYAIAARSAGIDVSIAAPRCAREEVESFVDRVNEADVRFFAVIGSGAFVASPSLIRWVARSVPAYDVVHVHGLFNPISSLASRAALRAGGTVVIRPFGTLSRYTFQHRRTALKKAYFRLIERGNLLGAAGLHFTTATERDDANWHGIDFGGRAHVVPPPSPGAIQPAATRKPSTTGAIALFLGRIAPVKNIESLLDAWVAVLRSVTNATLVIAGSGPESYVRTLHERAERLGIERSVTFRGFVSGREKQLLLSSASVFVLPSLHENFGIAVLESLEAGVPVVVSSEVQLAEFIRRHDLGRVAPLDSSLLRRAIVEVMADSTLRARARDFGPAIVAENFAAPVIGQLLSGMYEAAIHRSGATSPA